MPQRQRCASTSARVAVSSASNNAFGTEYNWPWYEGLLGNANYYDHGANQDGMVKIVSRNDSSTSGLPKTWPFR